MNGMKIHMLHDRGPRRRTVCRPLHPRSVKPNRRRHMKWITRQRPKIDRIACPWLIRRFIEADADFMYVPTEEVFRVASEAGETPYDIPGAEPFSHHGELCSF